MTSKRLYVNETRSATLFAPIVEMVHKETKGMVRTQDTTEVVVSVLPVHRFRATKRVTWIAVVELVAFGLLQAFCFLQKGGVPHCIGNL